MPKSPKQSRRADVPDAHHVARYCRQQLVIHDPHTNKVLGAFPQVFELRPREPYLSVYWMEPLADDIQAQFKGVLRSLRRKYAVHRDGAFARVNAGRVVAAGASRGHSIRIRDRSNPQDLGYASIVGTPADNSDQTLLALFVGECCSAVHGTTEIEGFG